MGLLRTHSETITNLSATFALPAGLYKSLEFAFDGTNQSGQTLTSANLGTLRIVKNGSEIHNVSVERLVDIFNVEYGVLEESSSAGAAFRHYVILPFHLPGHDDVGFLVRPGDSVLVTHNFPAATGTVVASGTATYYLRHSSGDEIVPYHLEFRNINVTAGAGGTIPTTLNVENVSKLYIENDNNLNSLSVRLDGKTIYGDIPRDDLYAQSQAWNRQETFSPTTPVIEVDVNPSNFPTGALSNTVEVEIEFGGAATVEIVSLSVYPAQRKLEQSIARRDAHLRNLARMKSQRGGGASAAVEYVQKNLAGGV